jgi:hypothetical protein
VAGCPLQVEMIYWFLLTKLALSGGSTLTQYMCMYEQGQLHVYVSQFSVVSADWNLSLSKDK